MSSGKDSIHVCLTDFGVSKMFMKDPKEKKNAANAPLQSSLRTSTRTGTEGYVAPEVMDPELSYGPKVDMWSAGVLLHVLLCGQLPGGRYSKVWHAISPDAKDLVNWLLEPNPDDRPSAREVLDSSWISGKKEQGEFTHQQAPLQVVQSELKKSVRGLI